MGLKLTILDTGPRTFAEEKARNEVWNRINGVSNTVFANDGTSEISKKGSYYPKTVKGPTEIEAGTEAIYEITEFALYKGKEENEEDLAKDKKQFKWVLYVDGVEIKNNLLKYITLRGFEKKEIAESQTDFIEIADAQKRTDAILQYGITYFKVEGEKKGEKTKITLKFSKWLDQHKIHIEAYRNNPDLKPKKPYVATTLVKAKPEIIKGFWVNENKDNITNSIIGYKETVFMCLKTLGMQDKTITTQLWEEDYGWGDEYLKTENNDLKITSRYTYKKLEIPVEYDETYQKQRGGAEGDQIELYFKLPKENKTLGFKDGFARSLKLTTKEKLTEAYFAIEKEREQIKDSTVLKKEAPKQPTTHTVIRNESLSSIAPKYNIKWEDIAKENNIKAPWYLKIGQVLKLPSTSSTSTSSETNSTEKKGEKEIYYERIDTSSLGSEVWLIVESANL
jgi:LysM repeat protein